MNVDLHIKGIRDHAVHYKLHNIIVTSLQPGAGGDESFPDMNMSHAYDDWHAFSMEMWGIHVTSWHPASDRPERLPEPLEYDVLQLGLIQLDMGPRHMLLQCISCYQVS
jgi:hypothetical protein